MDSKRRKTAETGRPGASHAVADLLAARHQDGDAPILEPDLTAEDRAELDALLLVARRLDARMKPRRPSPAFVRSLGDELMDEARRRIRRREKRHRIAVISAAVAGTVVSVASVVGGIVVLVKWLRTRSGARHPSTA